MISLIVATSENNVIGKDNQLLWHLPNDLKFFKNTTWGGVVIMGRKTFESVNKPLPGRINIVITKQANWTADHVQVASSVEDALQQAAATHCKELFVIGGGEIYKECLDKAHRIYLTRVHVTLEGDTFFPQLHSAQWKKISSVPFEADEKNKYAHTIEVWERA